MAGPASARATRTCGRAAGARSARSATGACAAAAARPARDARRCAGVPNLGRQPAAALVHFTPGARTAWHTHPHGQTIFVTEGVGVCQREGAAIEVIRPGDRVFFEPGENHWHGAAPNRIVAHVAMQQNDETGSPMTTGEHVSDEQYGAAPRD